MKEQIAEMANDLENYACMSQFQAEIASKMLYAKSYRKQEWISVEARVPEKYVTVLCFYPEKDYGSKIVPDYAENNKGYFANQFRYGTPSHWMPLPEPPREVEVKDYPAYLDRPKMKGGAE